MRDPRGQLDSNVISKWAHRTGLAFSGFFGRQDSHPDGAHFALLDGRRVSFVCSVLDSADISPSESQNWQWSADLAHHVLVTPNEVCLRSGADIAIRRFNRESVEQQLEEFLTFLANAGSKGLPDIVPFLVDEFLQIWSGLPGGQTDGLTALALFVLALQSAGESNPMVIGDPAWRRRQGTSLGLEQSTVELLTDLGSSVIDRAAQLRERAPLGLKIMPGLVLRHAAGRLFQEAHAYLETAQLGLWGRTTVTTVATPSPTGAYFTPVPIARLVAESAIKSLGDLPNSLVIADFACGSGVFLCEALRVLERWGYRGDIRLIGRDISHEAVIMARVAVATTLFDLPNLVTQVDVEKFDMLEATTWQGADIVLMNPPFRSWERMSIRQREWVKEAMGGTGRGRPDLSVAFVEHAIMSLRSGGVLATLVPAGVLASESLAKWRDSLVERASPKLIAVLGEHGLFRHAFVSVGIVVLKKESQPDRPEKPFDVAWAAADVGAASEAIRAVRRLIYRPSEFSARTPGPMSWTVTKTSLRAWQQRASWLPGPGLLGPLLDALNGTVSTRVEDLFHIHQGIRTGANEVFIISPGMWDAMPKAERRFCRPAVDAQSFADGEIRTHSFLFVPDPSWQSEADVRRAIPEFYRSRLAPSKDDLMQRKGIDTDRWWQLTRGRGWAFDGSPRLISKRFGLYPAFARDPEGQLAIVQANAWIPTKRLSEGQKFDLLGILTAYWWLLNSRVAVALLREFCPSVSGGQLDLENKYVKHVPLPNLVERLKADPGLQRQAMEMRTLFPLELPPIGDRDKFAADAFETSLEDWPIEQ